MKRRRILFAACFVAAFLAGFALEAAVGKPPRRERSRHLGEQLGLSVEQAARFKEIWASAMKESHTLRRTGFGDIRAEREEAVRRLLGEEDVVRYEEILAAEKVAREDFEKRRRDLFKQAVEETRVMLSDEQKVKYDELIAERHARHEAREERGAEDTEKTE